MSINRWIDEEDMIDNTDTDTDTDTHTHTHTHIYAHNGILHSQKKGMK